MNDTHPAIAARFRNLIMLKSPEERLLMGCSMFDAARQIVQSAICNSRPDITESELKKEIFIRFYGTDFNQADIKKLYHQ
jgi:hypothetical protein